MFLPEIEHVVYINLDKRTDRRAEVERELAVFGDRVHRFSAVEIPEYGALGCSRSHIGVLKMAQANGWKNVLVVEDDFMWKKGVNRGFHVLSALLKQEYDVIMLGGTFAKYDPATFRVSRACTTVAYLVNAPYYATLLANFEEGAGKLAVQYIKPLFAIDVYWLSLQPRDNWFIVVPGLVSQRPSYSDVENKHTDYPIQWFA